MVATPHPDIALRKFTDKEFAMYLIGSIQSTSDEILVEAKKQIQIYLNPPILCNLSIKDRTPGGINFVEIR